MALSSDLIAQFVKVTNDKTNAKSESTVYGTIVESNGSKCVKIDGSSIATPIQSTANVSVGDRVTVMIKNHTAIVTGNLSSPSARSGDIVDYSNKITELGIAIADKVSTKDFTAEKGRVDDLIADNVLIREELLVNSGTIETLSADHVTINETLVTHKGLIDTLEATTLKASTASVTYATISLLDATNVTVSNLEATYSNFARTTVDRLDVMDATIKGLEVGDLSAVYANIDFSNIGQAAMEHFYSASGLIDNVTISDGTITGQLIGVTLRGDLIEGNTIVADKLVIRGEDGLYYKLNTDGMTTGAEQTEYNSLNGSVIMAKSVTAEKVSVSDLVAFDATIGGFTITEDSIYSEVKDSEGNTTRGVYMDTDGQFNFGDANNFVKYYRDADGNYRLAISADSIMYTLNGMQRSVADLGQIGEYVNIGTYEGEPCIELGEKDSDFKLRITNTRMLFMEGTSVPAYFNNQSMHIKKAIVEDDLQQGGFVWKARSNGNLGLVWKGATT